VQAPDDLKADWQEGGGRETGCERALRYLRAAQREARRCVKNDDCIKASSCEAVNRDADTDLLQRWADGAMETCKKLGVKEAAICQWCEEGQPKCTDGLCVVQKAAQGLR
jgi:lysozyme family protein